MTPQEQQLLMQLTQKINQTQLQEKDPDAENLLGRELGANPDAMYILAQTVLVQNIALEQARAQVAQLQQQARQQQPAHSTSFLGRLLGERDQTPPPPPSQSQQQQPAYQPVPPQYTQPQYAQPQYQQAQYAAAPIPQGQPSFLRGAMQTAAGVAAGALAFEGVESVLHGLGGFGHPMGMGMGGFGMGPGMGMMGGFERPVEETVVNNYYGEPGGQNQAGFGGNEPHFHESSNQGGAQFSDASYNTTGNDVSANDGGYDQSLDDASAAYDNSVDNIGISDDDQNTSSFDDGGFDNSSGDLL